MLANFAKVFVLAGGIMAALMCFMMWVTDQLRNVVPMLELIGICLGVVVVLCFLVSLVVFRNRMHFRFRVDDKSAEVELIDTRAKTANAVALVGGVLTGEPALAGMGLIGMSGTKQSAVWSAIVRARYHPACHTVSLSNGWRTVINLFCTPENYGAVAAAVYDTLAAQPPRERRKSPLPMMLLRTALVIAACIPLFFLPNLDQSATLPALLTMAMVLTAIWLIPVMAWAALAGLGWLAVLEAMAMNETHTSMFGETYRNYELLSGDEQAGLVLAALGSAYLTWLSVGLLRGKVRSGLAGDMAEMGRQK
jgi:hypothetical protein